MPALVDVNEPSQLPPQPHPPPQQHEQQQPVHCSSTARRQPLVGIENKETFTAKEKEESLSSSLLEPANNPDSKENCPPPNIARKRSRSTVVTKGVKSMPAQTFSIVLPLERGGDTSPKCGVASLAKVEVEGKSKATRARANKGERRDISKETSRIDVDSARGGEGDGGVPNAASSDDLSQSEQVTTTAVAAATATTASADMYRKPDISYSHLILHAISQSPNERLTLREIYAWIETRHPFYRDTPTGWQNSIRHNLSSSKAFIKLERLKNDSGKGCFWTLHEDAHEILAASSNKKGRKSLADHDDSLPASSSITTTPTTSMPTTISATTVVRSRSASLLPKINCKKDDSLRSDLPSPAASEPCDDPKSPRSLQTKAKEAYAPSTPPSSPDYEADLEDKGVVLGNKTATVSTTGEVSSAANPLESSKTPMSPLSGPVSATTRRVRRPPQNLSEFVSSEDFKASFSKESSLAFPNTPLSPKPVERKRSKTLPAVSTATRERGASERGLSKDYSPSVRSVDEPSPITPTEELAALALTPSLSQELPEEVPLHRLVSVPLSSLSHMTHLKRSRDDMLPGITTKKWRREDQSERRRPRGRGRSYSLQETTYERRCREGKRQIVVASEDDWSSDSDDDFLCDSDLDGHYGVQHNRSISSSFNKADLLLLDSSAISYGFEMTDSEYILDFNQGPLFNSVVWPEYSNLQALEDSTTND
ncbi:hypothetical protein BG015_004294 [Linnemannia schmuckeri]|uniref:Fork-head domain-containing protein n=1 Tax=Linnemannia schmuckeri TaxID=64567 RepID=A0A9P5VCY8_9FUNG|nr:hypothetical protein BG015_004294 [Linnemannia schmuckeri]